MDRAQNLPSGGIPMIELPGLRFPLGEDIEMLRRSVRGFAAAEIAPRASQIDRSNEFPPDLWKKMGALGLLVSGVVMWFPLTFSQIVRELSILLHDVTFILFVAAIIWHVYLGTAAEPGTFGAMVRGTVTKAWARLHHGRWYRDVTGEEPRRD